MKKLLLLAACTCLAACATFERNVPEPRVYRLSPPPAPAGTVLDVNLLVLKPVVPPGLRSERIASVWPGNRVDYYAGARWSGELGGVVQGSLVQGIRGSGRVATVEADPGRFRSSHVLGIEIENFEADYGAGTPPVARVVMTATLARYGDRRALASWAASGEVAATENTLTAVSAALDAAYGRAAGELVARALDAMAADVARQP